MALKNSTEVKDIFCWTRQNFRSSVELLGKDKLEKGGIAYTFDEKEMMDLLDIKIYLMAGCETQEIKKIFNSSNDRDKEIADQIRQHEKNILILNFLRDVRSDIKEYAKLSPEQVTDVNAKSAQLSKLPAIDSPEYYEVTWDLIKLVFIIDFLTQNKSREADVNSNNKKVLNALVILNKLLIMVGKPVSQEDVARELYELSDNLTEDEQELGTIIKEVVGEFKEKKDEMLDYLKQNQIDPVTNQTDIQTGEAYKSMALHFYQFIIDYFVGESELNNLFRCIQDFIRDLDQEKLKNGEIKLKA